MIGLSGGSAGKTPENDSYDRGLVVKSTEIAAMEKMYGVEMAVGGSSTRFRL